MITLRNVRNLGGLLAVGLLLATTMGCNKMLANFSLSKAEKRATEAEDNRAAEFTPQQLEETQAKINQAAGEIERQDFKTARLSAKKAADLSKELLERTKTLRAEAERNEANTWIERARLNDAQSVNDLLFQQLLVDNQSGLERYDKQKWNKAIEIFDKVKKDVRHLLYTLETDAKQSLVETEGMQEALLEEGALEHAPEYVNEIDQQIEDIRRAIEVEYNYRSAIATADLARQTKQEGIQETKRVKSDKQLTEIENLLDEATNLGSEIYAPQTYRAVGKEFDGLITQYYNQNYDTVLTSAPVLKPKVLDLIVETKRVAAGTKIQEVRTAINNLVDDKARSYLPGRVELLESLLKDAKDQYDQEAFTDSKEVSLRALELEQKIIDEFDDLAQQEYSAASDVMGTAEGVFEQMQDIFDRQIPGKWSETVQAFEDSKQVFKEELNRRLNNARISLGLAANERGEQDFDLSIETAKRVGIEAEDVRQQTFRVVAHNAILDLSNMVSHYEREGGRRYARTELDKTINMLEECKNLLSVEQYREAVKRTSDTKAQLEVMVQELERVAESRILDATKALAQAKDDRAENFESSLYSQSLVSLEEAKLALEAEGMQLAIESAIQAETIAADASSGALRQWTEDLMRASDDYLAKARAADAARYAPEQFQKASDLRRNLQTLHDQSVFRDAIELGAQVVAESSDALYAKVIEAEDDIATARRYEGWEFERERLAEAIVSAKTSRDLMDKGEYNLSEQFAWNTIVIAQDVTKKAKRKGFEFRMNNLEARMEEARIKGAGYYQVGDLSNVLAEMNALRQSFSTDSYEDFAEKVERLDTQLTSLVEMTPDVLRDMVLVMGDQLAELERRGAAEHMPAKVDEVERKIKYAQIDYKGEKYRPSFQNIKDAQAIMQEVAVNLDEREFDADLNDHLTEFGDELSKFGVILNMGPTVMSQLIVGTNGQAKATSILSASSPSDLRTRVTEIGAELTQMHPPDSRVSQWQVTVNMLSKAKTASANFEKLLILDQYSLQEAKEIVQTAYLQMFQAKAEQEEIQRTIEYPHRKLRPAGVERVVSFQGY